jgi:hypothetical protein
MMEEYLIINKETLFADAAKISTDVASLKQMLNDATWRNCKLVFFKTRAEWRHVFVSQEYDVDWVMKEMKYRLED